MYMYITIMSIISIISQLTTTEKLLKVAFQSGGTLVNDITVISPLQQITLSGAASMEGHMLSPLAVHGDLNLGSMG